MQTHFLLSKGTLIRADSVKGEPPSGSHRFTSEKQLSRILQDWPMRRLVELWKTLPGVQLVQRFENRTIAVARLWRAVAHEPVAPQTRPRANEPEAIPAPVEISSEPTKASLILALLQRPEGASVKEIMAVTGWQPHSVRGFVSGNLVKKRRFKVHSSKRDGARVYHIATGA